VAVPESSFCRRNAHSWRQSLYNWGVGHELEPSSPPPSGAKALELLALAFVFPVATIGGFYAGRWLGGLVAFEIAGGLVGAVLGFLAGFWELYRLVRPPE